MPRDLSTGQLDNLQAQVTKPIYLIRIEFTGSEQLLSCSGDVVFDGDTYVESTMVVEQISDSRTATLSMWASDTRTAQAQNGTWRGGMCKIYAIPAAPDSTSPYVAEDGILMINGEIRSCTVRANRISIAIANANYTDQFFPRHTVKDATSHSPPAGTQIVWEGDRITLEELDGSLASSVSVASSNSANGRLTAAQLQALRTPTAQRITTVTATGAPIPIIYGNATAPGMVFAIGSISGDLVLGVLWSYGAIEEVTSIYINDVLTTAGDITTMTHYLGEQTQTVDPTLAAAIPAFNDPMIIETAGGDEGLAYSVFRFAPGDIDSSPTFIADIKGKTLWDTRGTPSTVYSDNSGLVLANLIRNQRYGLRINGNDVYGQDECADWCDSIIDGSFERCRISLVLSEKRRFSDYLDLLSEYAECYWFNEEDGIRIKPDKAVGADNPSGLNVVENSTFDADADWVKGSGWSIGGGVASCSGSQGSASGLSQDVPIEDGAKYAVSFELTARSAGSVQLFWGGVSVIDGQTAPGVYSAAVIAEGATGLLSCTGDSSFAGSVDNVTVKRLYYLDTNCVKDSMTMAGLDDGDTPSKVTMRYTDPSTTSGNWPEIYTSVSLPGVAEGDQQSIETTMNMPGVYRQAEASNKANAKLQRMVNRVKVSWVTTDIGIRHHKGDVIQLKLDNRGADILVRVQTVEMIEYGRYRVSGMRYDESHYPSELVIPDDVGVVPVGAIALLSGSSVPLGWQTYSAANDRFIVGAGGGYSVGETGGTDSHSGMSGNTDSVDSHGSASLTTFKTALFSAGDDELGAERYPDATPNLTHNHSFSTGSITPDVYRRESSLIQKTSSAASMFPKEAMVFGLAGLNAINMSRVTDAVGRLVMAASSNLNAGLSSQFVALSSGSKSDSHDHWYDTDLKLVDDPLYQTSTGYLPEAAGGSHSHNFNLEVGRNVQRRTLALYGGSDDYYVVPGVIVLWAGSVGSLPTDWVLCDGANQTPDMRDYFVEIAPVDGEGVAMGDNSLSVYGAGSAVGHEHRAGSYQTQRPIQNLNHSNSVTHSHTISDSVAWVPPYYALALIMYSP